MLFDSIQVHDTYNGVVYLFPVCPFYWIGFYTQKDWLSLAYQQGSFS